MRQFSFCRALLGFALTASAAHAQFVGGWGASAYQYAYNDPDIYVEPEQGCRLSVTASDNILYPGESARINVWGHFPKDAYAFAAAEFEMAADIPGWTYASGGVIAGADVSGISVSQLHQPFTGVFADPANPLRLWTGIYTPDSYEPRFVQVQATPSEFWYYPNVLTGSAAECEAMPGRKWLFINPFVVGRAVVAPGAGTTLKPAGDNTLIAQSDTRAILVGMLIPKIQKVRVAPQTPPTRLTSEIELEQNRSMVRSLRVTFSQVANSGEYQLQADWPLADSYEYNLSTFAGQTIRIRFEAADASTASLILARLPNTFADRVQLDPQARQTRVVSKMEFDAPARIITPDGREIEVNAIEVHACHNNLKQIAIGAHTFAAHGAGKVSWSYPFFP